ncbi:MAG TPA: response regulator transcription factor [Ignavibacteriaceae bacterium]|nr:response regulator transcription factor [Ignavibacteriaceae bacterium]
MKEKEKNISVWVIEDNEDFRSSLSGLINNLPGFICEQSFEESEKAIAFLKENPPPNIILSDIELPGMTGIEAIQFLKEISPDTHIIMLTVHDEHDKIFSAIQNGASGYLLKTASDEEIIESLHQVIDGGSPMNARIARSVLEMFRSVTSKIKEYGLTEREEQILDLMVKGLTKSRIAEMIFLSPHTIDFHVRSIYRKLEVNSRQGAVAKAVREKLL